MCDNTQRKRSCTSKIYKIKLNQEGDIQTHERKTKFKYNYCLTGEQLVDIFTKELSREKFHHFQEGVGNVKQMHSLGGYWN